MGNVLSTGQLNRSLLARQLLLRRTQRPLVEVVEHLVGLQAQAPLPPYLALWSRVERFDPHELGRLLTEREVVRLTLMRGTVHLVTPRDAAQLRPLVQPVIERGHNGAYGRRMGGVDPAVLAAGVQEILSSTEAPLTAREIARRLLERGVGDDVEAIGNATRVYAPLVQVPPRGVWGKGGQAKYAPFEAWTGRALDAVPSAGELVVRYLAAFGPASVMDAQNWSGLTKLGEAFERLRPRLVTFRDERGRELFDLPDAPRPDPRTPAPVRLLGEFDNVLLGHADRSRITPPDFPWTEGFEQGRSVNHLLVGGMLRGWWWIDRDASTLTVRPYRELDSRERDDVAAEARRALAFLTGREGEIAWAS